MNIIRKFEKPETMELIVITVIILMLQMLFLPCLCKIGSAKLTFGLVIDLLVLLRLTVAKNEKETGKVWIFYLLLLLTSPIWIELIFMLLGGH